MGESLVKKKGVLTIEKPKRERLKLTQGLALVFFRVGFWVCFTM